MYKDSSSKWASILLHKYIPEGDPINIFRTQSHVKGSRIWNYIKECREIIGKYLSWNVGRGDQALFWDDSWVGLTPINKLGFTEEFMEECKRVLGVYIKDYLQKEKDDSWSVLNRIDERWQEKQNLLAVLNKREVTLKNRSDILIWMGSSTRKYLVKEGYNSIIRDKNMDNIDIPLNLCWNKACLPKAGMFLWVALQNRILTADRFNKLGFEGPSRCPLCENHFEDVNHILLNCPFSQECWNWFYQSLGWKSASHYDLISNLKAWLVLYKDNLFKDIWIVAPSIVVWELWKERNRRIFTD